MTTFYYKNGMLGGTQKDRDTFYKILNEIKSQAIESNHEYAGAYSKFTYKFADNTKATYLVNDDYGVPYKIEIED